MRLFAQEFAYFTVTFMGAVGVMSGTILGGAHAWHCAYRALCPHGAIGEDPSPKPQKLTDSQLGPSCT